MYFKNRGEAGIKLAAELTKYYYEDVAVLALSEGGVIVGEQIARYLHATLSMLMTNPIELADMGGETVGVVDEYGTFTYNQLIPAGQLEEIVEEMRGLIEEEKLKKFYELAHLLGEHGLVDKHLFYGHNVIIVNDGLKTGMAVEAAVNFLKPVHTKKIIAAVPIVSVNAVDRLHILCDEIHVLSVAPNYLDTDHYYDDNELGDPQLIMDTINSVITKWH